MIKDLITDLAYDKISLAQGLTRAKLIQAKLKSDYFKNWLTNELNGYSDKDVVPSYRIFNVQIIGDFADDFGRQWKNTPLMLQDLGKSMGIDFYEHRELGSIQSIESSVGQCKPGETLMLPLSQNMVRCLGDIYKNNDPHTHLMSAGRIIFPSQYQVILDQTKQGLLDVLLELDDKFPDLQNDYTPTEENKTSVSNIITNNIYGNNNPMNIASGKNVTQSGNSITINNSGEARLKELGVQDEQIEELRTLLEQYANNKETLKSKTLKWLGRVSASIGARGLYDNIPALTEFVQNLI